MSTIDFRQVTLANELVRLSPLQEKDFEELYAVASDPLVWEQHPNKNRYRREVFAVYFEGAIASEAAFKITEAKTGETIGCSRFYDYDAAAGSVVIGYTFFARSHWGNGYNPAAKALMMAYAFTFANTVIFHIGSNNIRSQKAIVKIGAIKTGEAEVAYYGEDNNLNFIYKVQKKDWNKMA